MSFAEDPAARIAQLEQTLNELLGEMATLRAQQQPQTATAHVTTKNPKIAAPKPFDGELVNGETFLHQLHLYFVG